VGQTLLVIGLVIAAIGAAISLGLPLGRLPGDIVIRREGFTLYIPIATCIVVSLVLMLIGMIVRR
jgi:hypothetical protein